MLWIVCAHTHTHGYINRQGYLKNMSLCTKKMILEKGHFYLWRIPKYSCKHLISEIVCWLQFSLQLLEGNLSAPVVISHRHGVDLPFDLLVPRQGSLQTFLGIQLRIATLVNVSTNTRHNNIKTRGLWVKLLSPNKGIIYSMFKLDNLNW